MRTDLPGPLSAAERQLLDGFLGHDFPGVEALRTQARAVQAKSGCTCGCGTIDLVVSDPRPPVSEAVSPVPVEARVLGEDGKLIGGVLLFLSDGLLSTMEIHSYGDPMPLPCADQVDWQQKTGRRQ